jgi:hypothetical protein
MRMIIKEEPLSSIKTLSQFIEGYFENHDMTLSYQQKELVNYIENSNKVIIKKYRSSGTTLILCLTAVWDVIYGSNAYNEPRIIGFGINKNNYCCISDELIVTIYHIFDEIEEKVLITKCDNHCLKIRVCGEKLTHEIRFVKVGDGKGQHEITDLFIDEYDFVGGMESDSYFNYIAKKCNSVIVSYADVDSYKAIKRMIDFGDNHQFALKPYLDERYATRYGLKWARFDCRYYDGVYDFTPMEALELIDKGYFPVFINKND